MWNKMQWTPLALALWLATSAAAEPITTGSPPATAPTPVVAPSAPTQDILANRAYFLQLESLLSGETVSPQTLALAERIGEQLQQRAYPLQEEVAWLLLKGKLSQPLSPQALATLIRDFSERYPNTAKRQQLSQRPFEAFYQQQNVADLLAYAETVPAVGVENQCRLFGSRYQQLAEQIQLDPVMAQIRDEPNNSPALRELVQQFEQFWLTDESAYWKNHTDLPSACQGIARYWADLGLKTPEKIKDRAIRFVEQGGRDGLKGLSHQTTDPALQQWLQAVQQLHANPSDLLNFAETQPLDPWNKALMLQFVPLYIKTLSEQMENPDFARFQQWAEKFQLNESEQQQWKVAFIQRLFDHPDPIFQLWRDEQISQLKADSLTERRLRQAIWQQTELKTWLALLSSEAQQKAEWRYWLAKADPVQQKALLTALSQERGFYPMLAAHQLGQPYQLNVPSVKKLTDQQNADSQPIFARITELRALNRWESAKRVWVEALKDRDFDQKMAWADWANQQGWFDLGVEATIQAKGWDYLQQRVPNAYADWFRLHLQDRPISVSFAMAIARQESAWNPQARSHANAMGLMQMLASTAKATAAANGLPFGRETDLLDPFKNIMLGTAHLAELNQQYPHNRILMAAAYNAGVSRVTRWLDRAAGKLAMDEFIASIPFYETRGYVQNVLAYDFYHQSLYAPHAEKVLFTAEEQGKY